MGLHRDCQTYKSDCDHRFRDANILTASNELSSSLAPAEQGIEHLEAIQKELSMSEPAQPFNVSGIYFIAAAA